MNKYANLHFYQLKDILVRSNEGTLKITDDEEIAIRTIMRNKILAYRKNNIINSLVKDINKEKIFKDDDKYNNEIKKDKLNNNLLDRMNSELNLIRVKKQKNSVIESPYDNAKPISKRHEKGPTSFKNN
jgi:hypothetical protein